MIANNTSATSAGPRETFEQQVAFTVAIAVFGVWSTVGNILTILAITTRRYMKTKENVFIFSLAISDLLSGAIASPIFVYRISWGRSNWELGPFICKLYWFIDESTSYATAMHIAAFAAWRYFMVRSPHRACSIKIRSIVIWVIGMWVIALIFGGFIYSYFMKLGEKSEQGDVSSGWSMCSIDTEMIHEFKKFYLFASSTFMVLPMAILFAMSGLIVRELFFTEKFKSELTKKKERSAVLQLALIAAFFLFGYVPLVSYRFWSLSVGKSNDYLLAVDYWWGKLSHVCLRLSECFNPIIYNVASKKMRRASMEVLKYLWSCCDAKERQQSSSGPTSPMANGATADI